MKGVSLKSLIFILILATFNSSTLREDEKDKVLAGVILHSLVAGHYQQKEINDAFSEQAFNQFLKNLDFNKRFFTQADIEKLNKYKLEVDNELKAGNYDFMKSAFELFDKRIKEAEDLYKRILSTPFNYDADESFESDPEKYDFPKSKKELEESWRKYLKFQTLMKINELMDEQEKIKANKDTAATAKSFNQLEAEAREKVMKSQEQWFKRLKQLNETDRVALYINSVLSTYDPHSNFFPPKAKENFDIQLSGQLEGIGATLVEKDGYIKVEKIVPGSASWKQGELKAGDIIQKVAQGKAEPVDIANMRLDDAVQLIRGKKGTEVRLTVKKIDGSTQVIPIIRDVVILEETYAKSAVIESDGRFGYIKLPQFYADFNNTGGRSSAEDVKLEVEKLGKENIQGIIIDLRNNGGGSLKDVVDMAGLFIDKGPVVQVRSSNGALEILEDYDPSVQYSGPLVILVNELSASASEILAAAMQDYKRAVIIGGGSTYGKGTVQRMLDLDMLVPAAYSSLKPLGAMKLTTQKFYRINGGATQLKGVIPDIVLPDEFSNLEIGEKELDYVMPWDEIKPVFYKDWNKDLKMSSIKEKSKLRIDTNKTFAKIKENSLRLKRNSDKTLFSLQLDNFRKEQKLLVEESKKYDKMLPEITNIKAYALKSEEQSIKADTAKAERTKEWFKEIKKDAYINEAVNVLQDMK